VKARPENLLLNLLDKNREQQARECREAEAKDQEANLLILWLNSVPPNKRDNDQYKTKFHQANELRADAVRLRKRQDALKRHAKELGQELAATRTPTLI
jgi:hypothetical protein